MISCQDFELKMSSTCSAFVPAPAWVGSDLQPVCMRLWPVSGQVLWSWHSQNTTRGGCRPWSYSSSWTATRHSRWSCCAYLGRKWTYIVSATATHTYVPLQFCRFIYDTLNKLSYPGLNTSTKLMAQWYFWPYIKKECTEWAHSCLDCQNLKLIPGLRRSSYRRRDST